METPTLPLDDEQLRLLAVLLADNWGDIKNEMRQREVAEREEVEANEMKRRWARAKELRGG